MDPDLTNSGCKGHPKLITTPTNPLTYLLGVPLFILLGLHPLLGHIHPNTILNLLLIHFILTFSHNLSGMHLNKGGDPNTNLLPLFCLHRLLNHNHYLLLLRDNPKCLLNRTRTLTTDKPSRYILERQHALPMLWRFRRSTCDLGRSSQIDNLLLRRMKKRNWKVNPKPYHPFLRD